MIMHLFLFSLLFFLLCTPDVVAAFIPPNEAISSSPHPLVQRRSPTPAFQPQSHEETAQQALGFFMQRERQKQDAATAKAVPTLQAQREYTARRKEDLKRMQAARRLGIKIAPTARVGPSAKDLQTMNEELIKLHDAGRNIENVGAINRALRKTMLGNARPVENPTKQTQLGLRLVMEHQYGKHKQAAQDWTGMYQLMGGDGERLPTREQLRAQYPDEVAGAIVDGRRRFKRTRQRHGRDRRALLRQMRMAHESMIDTGDILRNVGKIDRGMYRYGRRLGPLLVD